VFFVFFSLICVCCVFNVISIMCSPTLIKTSKKIDVLVHLNPSKDVRFCFRVLGIGAFVFGVFDLILMCCGVYCA
jgi:hypothetical protein